MNTVPRETPVLRLTPSKEASPTSADIDLLAEARSWAPSTRRVYVVGWKHFTGWCFENRCPGLPSVPANVGRYIEHLVETEVRTMATARLYLATIAAAHRLSGHPDPTSRPLVRVGTEAPGR